MVIRRLSWPLYQYVEVNDAARCLTVPDIERNAVRPAVAGAERQMRELRLRHPERLAFGLRVAVILKVSATDRVVAEPVAQRIPSGIAGAEKARRRNHLAVGRREVRRRRRRSMVARHIDVEGQDAARCLTVPRIERNVVRPAVAGAERQVRELRLAHAERLALAFRVTVIITPSTTNRVV